MRKGKIKVVNQLGLHARAAAQLVRLASRFRSSVKLIHHERQAEANAKSILSVLALAAAVGTELEIIIDGEDEDEAWITINTLFANGFGEMNERA
ncbi:MAG TPA: HPr family phosphocarrier protein [Pyrinomonadaceae bacterium]|nr:HPr family phosphocarrier protein [Pyrinomonadaceae bacterium]